jgi:hypothetical protein
LNIAFISLLIYEYADDVIDYFDARVVASAAPLPCCRMPAPPRVCHAMPVHYLLSDYCHATVR